MERLTARDPYPSTNSRTDCINTDVRRNLPWMNSKDSVKSTRGNSDMIKNNLQRDLGGFREVTLLQTLCLYYSYHRWDPTVSYLRKSSLL